MAETFWTEVDTSRALEVWDEYRRSHDVSAHLGQTAGIEPISGRVWFGGTAKDVKEQMNCDGVDAPFYCLRVGSDYYLRKGGRR